MTQSQVRGAATDGRGPSLAVIVALLWGGVVAILALNYVYTIGATRLDYGDVVQAKETGSWLRQIFFPHLTVAIVTVIALTKYGLWGEIRLRLPSGARGWIVGLLPILAVLAIIDYGYFGEGGGPLGGFAALIAFGMVGLNEELLFRGFGLAALTRLYGLKRAVVVSTLLFGVAHSVNLFLGQSVLSTAGQVVATSVIGFFFALYTLGSRSLIAAMVLHGLWDFMLTTRGGESELTGALVGAAAPALVFALLVFTLVALVEGAARGARRLPAPASVTNRPG